METRARERERLAWVIPFSQWYHACRRPKKQTYWTGRCNVFQHVLETQEPKVHLIYFTYSAIYIKLYPEKLIYRKHVEASASCSKQCCWQNWTCSLVLINPFFPTKQHHWLEWDHIYDHWISKGLFICIHYCRIVPAKAISLSLMIWDDTPCTVGSWSHQLTGPKSICNFFSIYMIPIVVIVDGTMEHAKSSYSLFTLIAFFIVFVMSLNSLRAIKQCSRQSFKGIHY